MTKFKLIDIASALTLAVIASLISGNLIYAATTASVNATVTVQNVSVTLSSDGVVAYGNQSVGSTVDTTSSGINDTETVQNNGNVAEDFDIKGADSGAWTLASSAGADQYAHKFCTTTCDSSPTWTALTATNQALAASVAASGTQAFDLQLLLPSSSTDYTEQTLTVTVTASAS